EVVVAVPPRVGDRRLEGDDLTGRRRRWGGAPRDGERGGGGRVRSPSPLAAGRAVGAGSVRGHRVGHPVVADGGGEHGHRVGHDDRRQRRYRAGPGNGGGGDVEGRFAGRLPGRPVGEVVVVAGVVEHVG